MSERDQKFKLPTLFSWFLIVPARFLFMGSCAGTKGTQKSISGIAEQKWKALWESTQKYLCNSREEENVKLRKGFCALLFETIGIS